MLFQSYINQGYRDAYYAEILGVPHGLGWHRYVDGWVIVHAEHAAAFTADFIPRLDKPAYVSYFLSMCTKVSRELLAAGSRIRETTYSQAGIAELLTDFMWFGSHTTRVMPFLNTMVFVQDAMEDRVGERLASHYGTDPEDSDLRTRMQSLMAMGSQAPLASQAMAELGELALLIRSKYPRLADRIAAEPDQVTLDDVAGVSDSLASSLQSYLREYDFLGTNYYLGSPTQPADLFLQLGTFVVGEGEEEVEDMSAVMAELGPDDRALLGTAQHLQYLREYRLEALYKAGRDCRGLFTRIGEMLGTGYEETMFMSFREIQQSLTSGELVIDLATIRARLEGYASCVEDETEKFLVGGEIDSVREGAPVDSGSQDRLSGITAYPGDCIGPARVVEELAQVEQVKAGDVLIAPMTMPYHVPAMARSSAVITDEGGILSHAAIVARELRIPCVVGLNSATTTFRSGEPIRVRAQAAGGTVERVTT